MPAKPQTDPDLLVQELQLARLILESHDWDIIASVRMVRRVTWEVFMQHFRWNVSHAAKAARVNRTYLYEMLERAGVGRPKG